MDFLFEMIVLAVSVSLMVQVHKKGHGIVRVKAVIGVESQAQVELGKKASGAEKAYDCT